MQPAVIRIAAGVILKGHVLIGANHAGLAFEYLGMKFGHLHRQRGRL